MNYDLSPTMRFVLRGQRWYNFRTQEYDNGGSCASDYIPQSDAAQMLYDIYTEHEGDEPMEAVRKVLEAVAGEGQDELN